MNNLIGRDLFDVLHRYGDFFDRDAAVAPPGRSEWLPPVDIQETDTVYTFRVEVPGFKSEDLDVELHDGVLSIRGTRNAETREEESGFVRVERRRGSFSRQFRVPTSTSAQNLSARLADGLLTIDVPKSAEPQARKVSIS
jgi:HSP20 family protein